MPSLLFAFEGDYRRLFHIQISSGNQGKQKLLPVYLHFAEADEDWANSVDYDTVMKEIVQLFLDNLEEVEDAARSETKTFLRLPAGKVVSVAFIPNKETHCQNIINLGPAQPVLENVSSFSVLAWIFPADGSSNAATHIEQLEMWCDAI